MELIAAILIAGPLGYFIRTRKQALLAYLGLWATIFPIQTIVVFHESGDDNNAMYWVVNAVILTFGIGMNTLGLRLRARRALAS
jgi:peptidoglycan/LPS O-acetylase OafA/YrhL